MLQSDDTQNDKLIQLTENYRLKYDIYKNKWIEHYTRREVKNEKSKTFGKVTYSWTRVAGYYPTYELLLWDFAIKHTAKAELKSAHEIIEKIAEAERLVSEYAKAIGKELDNGN